MRGFVQPGGFLLGLVLAASLWHGRAGAQDGRPLVDHYTLKLGASYSRAFIRVTRLSDQSQANLVSDSDYSPYVSLATPPWFLGDSGFAIGLSASYSSFEASQQEFPDQGPASLGTRAEGTMVILTPSLSYYLGRTSPSQFLRISGGVGWAKASFKGQVQFGDTPGAEPSEAIETPDELSTAVLYSIEYRLGPLSLAYQAGGPRIETKNHEYQLGDDAVVLAWAIAF